MSTKLMLYLDQIDFFDNKVKVELLETIESTAAIHTRFKVYKKSSVFNVIYKDFRSNWFGGGKAELIWYDKFAPKMNPQISPRFFGGDINEQAHHCHLFLEDLSETHYKAPETWKSKALQQKSFEQAIESLLQLHIHWWNDDHLKHDSFMSPQGGPLRLAHATNHENIRHYVQSLHHSFPKLVENIGPNTISNWIPVYEQAIRSWEELLTERIADDENLTLLHGDFHVWNIFFPKQPKNKRSLIVDWETYKRGLGVYDLAYLMITGLDVSVRREKEQDFLRRYHNGLQQAGIEKYNWQDCLQDYRLSIVANLFPPVMWKSGEKMKRAIATFEDWNCWELLK